MRATPTLLLVLGISVFSTVAVLGAASKIPSLRTHGFLGMNAYAQPSTVPVVAPDPALLRAQAWSQYREQVTACSAELRANQDACLQQARRERKQNSGMAKKSVSPKPQPSAQKMASAD